MCGIAGIVALSPDERVEAEPLGRMAAQLVHRGPDDEGFHVDPQWRCGLAFRRLSVIDLAGGHQPMSTPDSETWLVFNGEIYNFRKLRAELEAAGCAFRTQCDSEVILHAYQRWGEACFEHFAGMFALAIWDQPRGRLLLARDRFGKKPLVYAIFRDRLYFASEAKAILALPEIPRELDPRALHEYLLFQYVPAPHAIFRGFRKLPPGHVLAIEAGRPLSQEPRRWWTLPAPKPFEGSYDDARRALETRLEAAVRRRLIADVPLGAFLSGGMDSSIVVALMRQLGVSPLRTFSIGFDDPRYDESGHARRVAAHLQTEHHEFRVTPQSQSLLDSLAWHYDEPFADSSAIPTWCVAHHARPSVTVALTGDAGDEAFLGYDRYRAAMLAARFDTLPAVLRRTLAAGAVCIPHGAAKSRSNRLYRFLSALGESPSRRYLSWVNVFPSAMLAAGYRPEFAARIDASRPLRWFDSLYSTQPLAHGDGGVDLTAAERANRVDFESYLPGDLLTKVDIASMACGLECRCPLLDHELVEFALSLPAQWRMSKRILRDWAAPLLPAEVLTRPKMGFGVPVGEWFRGPLRERLTSVLTAADSVCTRAFRPDWTAALLEQHITGRANHEHRLWALLMLETWAARWRPA